MRYITASILGSLILCTPTLAFPSFTAHKPWSDSISRPQSSWRTFVSSIVDRICRGVETQSLLSPLEESKGKDRPSQKLVASYGQDVVLRFTIDTEEEARSLAEAANDLFLDVWDFNRDWVDIRITKDVVPSLLGLLPASLQTKHVALLDNLDLTQAIFDTYPSPSSTTPHDHRHLTPSLEPSFGAENIFFKTYQPLSVIVPWMDLLASMFPTHARMLTVGTTYEGRDIPALLVGTQSSQSPSSTPRKTILLTGGLHAREWISTSTITYLAWSLITRYGKDSTTTTLLDSFDWIFVPTLNPDGYVYTWDTDRLWRKNRQPTTLRFCRGIDLDRSFAFHWDGAATQDNPCSESYAGSEPFEAVEAARFAAWARNETDAGEREFVALLDLHSYSQQVLYPYSYSCAEEPPTVETLEELALGLAKAIRVSRGGRAYTAVAACEGNVATGKKDAKHFLPRIESGGGSALDYFYHELHVRYAFQVKLRDTGSYGFLLPKENILPTGREMLEAVMYLGRFMAGDVGLHGDKEDEKVPESEEVFNEESDSDSDSDSDTWTDDVADDQPEWEQAFVQAQLKSSRPKNENERSDDDSDSSWELKRRRRR